MHRFSFFLLLLVVLLVELAFGLDNGQAIKPQMGWNSWNHFGCNIQEALIRDTAQAIVDTGLKAAGYQYVNLDDCWAVTRDSNNLVHEDPKGFPSGMFALGQFVHGLGLKFGIYSDAGTKTCAGRPGSLSYEVIDALRYAAWEIDYLKYDNCNSNSDPQIRYPPMRDALNATGRPILFSMCEWGVNNPATWAGTVGNSWRTTGDINDHWDSFTSNLDQNDKWWNYSGPGHWNDPDMLEVGNGGMTTDEYISHFSLWCLIKSPLLIGCDVTKMSDTTKMILTNAEVIALSQDDLGVQGHKLSATGTSELWGGPLANGNVALILFNRGSAAVNITVTWTIDLGMEPETTVSIRDLWAHKDLGQFTNSYSALVNSHASQTIVLTPTSKTGQKPATNIWTQYKRHPNMKKLLQPNYQLIQQEQQQQQKQRHNKGGK